MLDALGFIYWSSRHFNARIAAAVFGSHLDTRAQYSMVLSQNVTSAALVMFVAK